MGRCIPAEFAMHLRVVRTVVWGGRGFWISFHMSLASVNCSIRTYQTVLIVLAGSNPLSESGRLSALLK
jgi:hypothetical protein